MEEEARILEPEGLEALLQLLWRRGYEVIGPRERQGVIEPGPVRTLAELPAGRQEAQGPGRYRLADHEEAGIRPLFAHRTGPAHWQRLLHPVSERLWSAGREEGRLRIRSREPERRRYAFFGIRGCDLAALAIQDRVLAGGLHPDARYRARREGLLTVAVDCTAAAQTCFCRDLGCGPGVGAGFDLRLTEFTGGGRHLFLAAAGSEAGRRLLAAVPSLPAGAETTERRRRLVERASAAMERRLPREADRIIARSLDHPRWQAVGARCLACGNCTAVCPTCFCSRLEERTGLDPDRAEHWRVRDSCFDAAHSELHGGPVRRSRGARYRQWLAHKLLHWQVQFGTPGCTGCGRCITWCPVGIDLAAEVRALEEAAA